MAKKDKDGNVASPIGVMSKATNTEFDNVFQNMFNGQNGTSRFSKASKEGKDINYFDTFFRVPYGNLVPERTSTPKIETLK